MDLQNKEVKEVFNKIAKNAKILESASKDTETSLFIIGRSEASGNVGRLVSAQGTVETISTAILEQMLEDKSIATIIEVAYKVYENNKKSK